MHSLRKYDSSQTQNDCVVQWCQRVCIAFRENGCELLPRLRCIVLSHLYGLSGSMKPFVQCQVAGPSKRHLTSAALERLFGSVQSRMRLQVAQLTVSNEISGKNLT